MSAKIGSPSALATASNTSDLQRTQPHPAAEDKSQQVEAMSRESSREKKEEIEEEIAAEADDESDEEEPEVGHDYPTIFVPCAGNLAKLSSLGHFLKGSSAALGIIKVQASCEKMQHYGNCRDEEAGADLDSAEALKRIEALLVKCKKDYKAAKNWMVKMYDDLK
ncbi:osomolarity two-component system, phosphorelay intermediate protein YPD1 [Cryptococcus deuterogattii MMRL2647]|nr:osomolarity two-component system, phosphorelay intermediate protein YPD1 [Cryptococcus deuterogattii MMRL2647]